MARCCNDVVGSVHLCSKDSTWTRWLVPRRIKRKAIHIQMKCMPVFKSSQFLFVLIIWKAAGAMSRMETKKKDILLDECQEERKTKAVKEDNEITMRKNRLQTGLCALLLRFINTVLMKIDEHYQRDRTDRTAELVLDNVNAKSRRRSRGVQRN